MQKKWERKEWRANMDTLSRKKHTFSSISFGWIRLAWLKSGKRAKENKMDGENRKEIKGKY